MPISNLLRGLGKGTRKLVNTSASVTGTGDIDTGLSVVEDAVVSVKDAPTTVPTRVASISAISGGTVSVVVVDLAASANSIADSASTVECIAVGY